MIQVKNLRKEFGSKVPGQDGPFKVEKGEVLGFPGPHGPGQSTTLTQHLIYRALTTHGL